MLPAMSETPGDATVPPRSSRAWVGALGESLERLPIPVWASLALAGLVTTAVMLALAAQESGTRPEAFTVYFSLAGYFALGLVHYLERASGWAFDRFRPALAGPRSEDGQALRHRITGTPPMPAAAASLAGIALGAIVVVASGPLAEQLGASGLPGTGAGLVLTLVLYVLNWATIGALAYRIVHQSRRVADLYRLAEVDIFRPAPLHALAWLGAFGVAGLAIVFYAPILLIPDVGGVTMWLVRAGVGAILLCLFVWPLWGVHELLASEHEQRLARNAQQQRAFYDAFHGRLEAGERGVVDVTRNEIDLLEREQRALGAVSRWPWPANLISAVVGAVVLPLVVTLLISFVRQVVGL
jgi:hypothetical protein